MSGWQFSCGDRGGTGVRGGGVGGQWAEGGGGRGRGGAGRGVILQPLSRIKSAPVSCLMYSHVLPNVALANSPL